MASISRPASPLDETIELGGRDLNQSAVIISLKGAAGAGVFDILIDGVPRARLSAGASLPIFLEAYRSYELRLRPIGAVPLSYDTASSHRHALSGHGGETELGHQAARHLFWPGRKPGWGALANASVTFPNGIGQTDDRGYFQVDAAAGDVLEFRVREKDACRLPFAAMPRRRLCSSWEGRLSMKRTVRRRPVPPLWL